MKKIFSWIKTNKLSSILILIVLIILLPSINFRPIRSVQKTIVGTTGSSFGSLSEDISLESAPLAKTSVIDFTFPSNNNKATQQRMVVTNSNFSLLVKNVIESVDLFLDKAKELDGFMVNKDINMREYSYSARISVRIPSEKIDEYTQYLRRNSMKVVSENIDGQDVTDQYTDIQERISRLEETKSKLENILDEATDVDDILRIQQRIFGVQDQIDSYIGQKQYLETTSKTSLISIYLSSDELSLPFTPDKPWKPVNVFKMASRSMLKTAQQLASLLIWVVVYIPIMAIAVIIIISVKKLLKKHKKKSGSQ